MNDKQVSAVIHELERALIVDDPAFVRRFHRLRRCDALNAVIVFVFLAVGAVFLAVTLATTSAVPGVVAVAALVGAVLADELHQRTRRQQPAAGRRRLSRPR